MLNNGLYYMDGNNKLYNKLESSSNIGLFVMRDLIFSLLGLPLVMYFLVDDSPINGVYFYSNSDYYAVVIGLSYFTIACLYNVHLFFQYLDVECSAVKVDGSDITIYQDKGFNQSGAMQMLAGSLIGDNSRSLLGRAVGMVTMNKGAKAMFSHSKEGNENSSVVDLLGPNYGKTKYTNCKLLSNKKKYFVFSGESDGKLKKFKVYKIYKNVDGSSMEVM